MLQRELQQDTCLLLSPAQKLLVYEVDFFLTKQSEEVKMCFSNQARELLHYYFTLI